MKLILNLCGSHT